MHKFRCLILLSAAWPTALCVDTLAAMRRFIIYLKDIIFIKKISYSWNAAMVI